MAGYSTLVLYFHSPVARENMAAHSCIVAALPLLHNHLMDLCSYLRKYTLHERKVTN